jgi:hypothetical protein
MPTAWLIEQLGNLMMAATALMQRNEALDVPIDPDAEAFLDQVDYMADDIINASNEDAIRDLWNRTHLKTMKLAALVAVGCNFYTPRITLDMAKWAYSLVIKDVLGIVARFERGEIGKVCYEAEQLKTLRRTILEYVEGTYSEAKKYSANEQMHRDHIIPYSFLNSKLRQTKYFKNDRQGGTAALKRTLQTLIDDGAIMELGKGTLMRTHSFCGKAYEVVSRAALELT